MHAGRDPSFKAPQVFTELPRLFGRHMKPTAFFTAGLCSLVACAALGAAAAQSLRITAPPSGTVVHPGETINVVIESPDAESRTVTLIGDQGFEMFLAPLSPTPAHVEVKIPKAACCGDRHLTAVRTPMKEPAEDSIPIILDVEPTEMPIRLKPLLGALIFRHPAGSFTLVPQAVFPDGTELDVTYSSRITYASLRPEIATVDWQGEVTAKAPGKTSIVLTYAHDARKVQAIVPVDVHVGPVSASRYAVHFPEQPMGTSSTQETIRLTVETWGPVTILSLKAKGDFAETDNCTGAALPHAATCSMQISFTPRGQGKRSGEIDLESDYGETLTVSLEGTGR